MSWGIIYDLEICSKVQSTLLYQLTQKHFCHLQVSTQFLKLLFTSNEDFKELIQFSNFPTKVDAIHTNK